MALSSTSYLNGISALICMILGIIFGIYFFYLYSQRKKSLMPWIAITAIGMGFLYFGPAASFIKLVITGSNLTATQYGQFSYTSAAIAAFTGMYAGFSIFDPKHKNLITWIYAIAGIIFLVSLYAFPQIMITSNINPNLPNYGELMDINLNNVVLVITAFYILSFVFIQGIGFLRLYRRIKDKEERKHSLMLGIGWILFAIAGTIDAIFPVNLIHLIVIARVMMAAAFILIYIGFAPPKAAK